MADYRLETITGRSFSDQEVRLDGREFVGCNFRNCMFSYGGGVPFILSGNEMEDCRFEFIGAAQNTFNALRSLQHSGMTEIVDVVVASIRKPLDASAETASH